MSQLALDAVLFYPGVGRQGPGSHQKPATFSNVRRSLQDTSPVARGSCFCSAVPRGEAPFFNMAFTFRYYDVRMPQEPLHIEDVSGTPSGQRMLRLRGPIVLSNFFEFQSMVRGNTSRHLILDLTGVPYIDSAGCQRPSENVFF